MILKRENLERIDEEIFLANNCEELTVIQLDNILANRFSLDSVFKNQNQDLESLSRCQRLCYYVQYQDDKVYDSVLVVIFDYDIDNTPRLKNDLSNCIVKNIRYDILDLNDSKHLKMYNRNKHYACMLDEDIQEHLRYHHELTETERKDVLKSYIDNGL